ncbi:hypothetical protein MMC24_002579 [Lignoscripta atroalba]|nr:hypothetical protein [Lignoscripta atroalba]
MSPPTPTPPPNPPPLSPSPSSSPSPLPPPTPLTPGPLFTRLSTLYTTALTHTLRTCSYANFAACFPTPAAQKPELLAGVWEQIVARIRERAVAEFEDIVREREVVGGLNGWERVVGEARGRRERGGEGGKVGLHMLPPEQLYLAHLSPYLQETQRELDGKIRGVEVENEELMEGIKRQREEVERLVGGLEGVIGDLEGANEVMDGVLGDGEVRREVVEVEMEVRAVGREAKL